MVPDQFGNFSKPDDDAEVSILLASEIEWRPFVPHPSSFDWADIGLAGARIPRFNGQLSPKYACKIWDNYVLDQHLCLCSDLAELTTIALSVDMQLAIHLHDGEESLAGLGDPVGPVKHSPRFRAPFKAYLSPMLDAIADKARIDRALLQGDPVVKSFDKLAYRCENFYLRGIGSFASAAIPPRHRDAAGGFRVWGTQEAYERWMARLDELLALKVVANG